METAAEHQINPVNLRNAKKVVNNLHTKTLELATAEAALQDGRKAFRETYEALIGETLFVGGNVARVRFVKTWVEGPDGRVPQYEYPRGGLAEPYLGSQYPTEMVVADDPFSARCESIIFRPEIWDPAETSLPDLVFDIKGLQILGSQAELVSAQRRFDRLHPNL